MAAAALTEALGGTVSIAGAVSGTGLVEIGGGSATVSSGLMTIAGAFAENVTFTAGKGELALSKSQGYTGTISGFSKTGADTLDLRDIGFIDGLAREPGSLTITLNATRGVAAVTITLHTDPTGGWSGTMRENGAAAPVKLRRG